MNIYFCKRGEKSWEGGLIISAYSEERAKEIFIQKEDGDKPTYIQEITPEEEGVMYCDDLR